MDPRHSRLHPRQGTWVVRHMLKSFLKSILSALKESARGRKGSGGAGTCSSTSSDELQAIDKVRMAVFIQHHVDGLDSTVNPLLHKMSCFQKSASLEAHLAQHLQAHQAYRGCKISLLGRTAGGQGLVHKDELPRWVLEVSVPSSFALSFPCTSSSTLVKSSRLLRMLKPQGQNLPLLPRTRTGTSWLASLPFSPFSCELSVPGFLCNAKCIVPAYADCNFVNFVDCRNSNYCVI